MTADISVLVLLYWPEEIAKLVRLLLIATKTETVKVEKLTATHVTFGTCIIIAAGVVRL